MIKFKLINRNIILLLLFSGMLFFVSPVFAIVMGSQNYQIERDSINSGGNEISTSSNFSLFDTVGEIATGQASSSNYNLFGGYRQMDASYISMTVPGDIFMSPNIGGVSGGVADGEGLWNVKTDSPAGYTLYVRSESSPAMISGVNYFADYTPSNSGIPDYNWGIGVTNSEFGFSPYNPNSQVPKYKNTGVVCNSGVSVVDGKCWNSFSTSNEAISIKNFATSPSGEDTKINFRAEVNAVSGLQVSGLYMATIIVTAVSN